MGRIKLPDIDELNFVKSISPDDWMGMGKAPEAYFRRGFGGLAIIVSECNRAEIAPESILDFGCGHGAVSRMLKALFPDSRIVGQDVKQDWLDWCERELEIETVLSPLSIRDVALPVDTFDIIWAGSIFSHIPPAAAAHLLKEMRRSIRSNGIIIFSANGQVMANGFDGGEVPHVSADDAREMRREFDSGQYTFRPYINGPYPDWGHALAPVG